MTPARPLYLDANATECLRPEAREALCAALEAMTGNPASVHGAGRAARQRLEAARRSIADRFGLGLGKSGGRLVFTSGGTEANALALTQSTRRLIVGATEHPAVRAARPDATVCPVGTDGQVDLDALERLLAEGGPAQLALMAANNETGVIHPWPQIASLVRRHRAWLHVDAVQAAGRLDLRGIFGEWQASSVAISAHKLGAPAGAGALLLAPERAPEGDAPHLAPMQPGGGQEGGLRGGTQPLALIEAMAAALAACDPAQAARLAATRDRIETAARACGAQVCGSGAPRLPNTTCLALPGRAAQTQLIALDLAGIEVSAGAACSSGRTGPSEVLAAMGLGRLAGEAIRVSLPWNAPADTAPRFAAAYRDMTAMVPA